LVEEFFIEENLLKLDAVFPEIESGWGRQVEDELNFVSDSDTVALGNINFKFVYLESGCHSNLLLADSLKMLHLNVRTNLFNLLLIL
jgi:hypothetical protein